MKRILLLALVLISNILSAQTPGGVPSTDLDLWVKANTSVTDAGTLIWGDESGKGNNAFQATTDDKPVQSEFFNFNETFTFDGANDFFAISNINYTGGLSIDNIYTFVVYKTPNATGGANGNWAFLDFDRSEVFNVYVRGDDGRLGFSFPDNVNVPATDNNIFDNYGSTSSNNDVPHIGTFIYDKDVTQNTKLRLDGNEDFSANRISSGIITDNETRYGFIGDGSEANVENGGKNDVFYDGEIAEIIYFNDLSLTISERTDAIRKIESYLALKYGITLNSSSGSYRDSGNNIIWDNTSYWNNVFGLINDNVVGSIDQKVASALNTSLIISTTNDFTSSNSNIARTSLTAGTSILFGDNGLTGFQVFDAGASENVLRTTWLVKENGGDSGTIHIAIPEEFFPTGIDVDIITSTDEIIDTGDNANRTTMVLNSGFYTTTLNLIDGQYFSFVTSDIQIAGVSVTEFDLFIRADQSQTSGGTLTIEDASYNSADAVQTNGTSTPSTASLMNFNPTLTFDGQDDYLFIKNKMYEAGTDITDMHVMAVYSTDFDEDDGNGEFNNNWSLLDFDRSEAYNAFVQPTGELAFSYEQRGGGIIDFKSTSVANDGLPHIAEFLFDRSLSNIAALKFDGNVEGSVPLTTNVTNPNVNNGATANLNRNIGIKTNRFGFIGDGSEALSENGTRNGIHYDGQISEIILADRKTFTTNETFRLETYLGLKYGITLDQSVQYLNSAGITLWDNTAYWSGIAGIVRDDVNSDLDQKIATSTSAKDLILSTDLDFTSSNLSGSRTSVPEGVSLLFGNNGLSTGFTDYNVASNEFITVRKWLFKEVGTYSDNVYVAIPKSFFSESATGVDLLLSTNDNFEFAEEGVTNTRISLTDDGTHYYINRNMIDGDRIAFILTIPIVPSPGAVSGGLNMWIKGDLNAVSSNGILTSIGDSSAAGNGVVQSVNNDKPSNDELFSYNPAISFDGVSDHLAIENLNFSSAGEIDKMYSWVVYETTFSDTPATPDDTNWALLSFDRDHYFNMSVGGDGSLDFSYTTSGGIFDSSGTTITNTGSTNIGGFIYDTALGANETLIKLNGAEDFSGDVDDNNIGSGSATRFGFIGDGSNATSFDGTTTGDYYDGKISEVLYYQGVTLSDLDISKIESYLGLKYGVTLDNLTGGDAGDYHLSTSTTMSPVIVWDASTNADYHNNIAAIGRDDDSQLNQKQGRSTGLNSMLSISIDTSVALDNASNMGSFDDNLDFLVWGSKITGGDAITLIDADTPTGDCLRSTKQVNRDWKVQNTGSVGTVTLQFDMSAIPDPDNYNLRIDQDGDGDYTTGVIENITSGVLTGNNLIFTGVDLLDGEVFTLVSKTRTGTIIFGNDVWFGGSGTDNALSTSDTGESVQILNDVTLSESAVCFCMNIASGTAVTIPTTQYLELEEDLELDGDLYLEGDAELIQTGNGIDGNSGSGQIFKIIDDATASEYRYNYFASPVNTSGTFTLSGNLKFNSTDPADDLTDNTDPSFTDSKQGSGTTISRRWIHTLNNSGAFLEVDENETMIPGVGFTMKGTGAANEYNFIGSPNNGNINVSITSGNFLLTGNPYPSTMNLQTFLTNNASVLENTAYLWDQPAGDAHATGIEDDLGGYATFNSSGVGVSAATIGSPDNGPNSGSTTPTAFIKPGQGFVVYGETTGTVQFTNALRDGITFDGSRHFFKTNSLKTLTPIIRLGIEYVKEDGRVFHRQIATTLNGGTLDKEFGDSFMFDYFSNDAFWVIPEDVDRYIITSVPFVSDDLELPVGVVVENEKEITFKLDEAENYSGEVYLYDEVLKTITNIKKKSHKITLQNGEYRDRFSVMFSNQETLSNEFVDNKTKTLIRTDKNEIEVILEKGNIQSIALYSIAGEKVLDYIEDKITNRSNVKDIVLSSQFYIIKVKTDIGTVNKKVFIE
ncbi:hypothetical protein ACXGQW_02180 [Wenyingzhuangia sp. IMCC45533]